MFLRTCCLSESGSLNGVLSGLGQSQAPRAPRLAQGYALHGGLYLPMSRDRIQRPGVCRGRSSHGRGRRFPTGDITSGCRTALLVIVVIVLIALAAKYIW